MNWGTKAALGLAAFMLFIVVLGSIMFNSRTDALVENDYYEKGIAYDKVYNKKEQVKTDHAIPLLNVSSTAVTLQFRAAAKGSIRLMRTSDKKLDRLINFESGAENKVSIPAANLLKGSWRLIADWQSEGKDYLYEQEITIK